MNLQHELRVYLDTLTITSDNIGDIRRSLFVPWDSAWNGIVRDETAARERPSTKIEHVCGLQGYCPGYPHYDPPCPACVERMKPSQL
jgi:hypothetical protein